MEYADDGSQGSYHTPKLGEENVIPVPVLEPVLPPADQSCPDSDQENIVRVKGLLTLGALEG